MNAKGGERARNRKRRRRSSRETYISGREEGGGGGEGETCRASKGNKMPTKTHTHACRRRRVQRSKKVAAARVRG